MSIASSLCDGAKAAAVGIHHPESTAARLAQSQLFHDYRAAFEVATGLQLALVARPPRPDGRGRWKRRSVRDAITVVIEPDEQHLVSLLPVRLGEITLGWLRIGPFIAGANVTSVHRSVPVGSIRLPALGPTVHRSVLRLLRVFSLQLAESSNELLINEHRNEPCYVQTARDYIEAHLTETLSLTAVAAAVRVSPYYFCKRFFESTGLHFTDYVNRARVIRVKERLLNPHVHVSEAAFASGFQSLSQFNRAFRRVTGESPSTFRHRLHDAPALAPSSHAAA